MNGNKIIKYIPTVFIVDSVKMVMSEINIDREESTNMDGATNAKANSEYYTRMVPLCRQANIIMLLINHISTYINSTFSLGGTLNRSEIVAIAKNCQYVAHVDIDTIQLSRKGGSNEDLITIDDNEYFSLSNLVLNITIANTVLA